ncbi:MAG: hypothetical protein U0514_00205 [Candidatus Andersenbacteria bacterium]
MRLLELLSFTGALSLILVSLAGVSILYLGYRLLWRGPRLEDLQFSQAQLNRINRSHPASDELDYET